MDGKWQLYGDEADEPDTVSQQITVTDMLLLLEDAQSQIAAGNASAAYDKVQQFILQWPNVETQISTRSKSAYQQVENKMIELSGYLVSQPPDLAKANQCAYTGNPGFILGGDLPQET
ncbi:hypothetical protein [Paenibacillus pinihumi]|uniref:hypothetical protein n=1 Tax=Paenibacillus pinihumi TaxID=669462 RepID=UPI000492165C|nr:hypothetical protein [Paenibacillus pinihumi]